MPRTTRSSVLKVPEFLGVLRDATSRLPDTVPYASINDPVYRNFHEVLDTANEGTFEKFEQAFKQCFKPDPDGLPNINNIMRGEHGMGLIISYLDEFAKPPTMSSEQLRAITLRITELVEMVQERIKEAPRPVQSKTKNQKSKSKSKLEQTGIGGIPVAKKVRFSNQSDGYDGDGEFVPASKAESSEEELDMESENEFGILGFGQTKNKSQVEISTTDENTTIWEPPRHGRDPVKGNWAMSHYSKIPKPAMRKNGTAIWAYICNWCGTLCGTPRTPGITNWDEEVPTLKNFNKSNFITHIEKRCTGIPEDQKYFANVKAQEKSKFSLKTPAIPLNQREFNSSLAKAVVRDNHAMTFGEGDSMIEFFQSILPNIRLPVHQTLQRHLYRLFDILANKVRDNFKAIERHAISTDAWTSKNSVYSLAGVIIFFIDNNWHLNELVVDVINLDAEHSGSFMGKLVYSALKAKGAARQTIACVTDNASTNSVMNETLATQIRKHENTHAHGKNISFTCIAHAIHLVCTALTSHLGVIEPSDHFSEVKGSNLEGDDNDAIESEIDSNIDTESESNFDDDLLAELAPELAPELASTDDERPTGHVDKTVFPKPLTVIEKAITYFVANLDSIQSRGGKSRKIIQKLQICWNINGEEWDLAGMVAEILDPFRTASAAMSRRDVATLSDVIPTFALLERKLVESISQIQNPATDRRNVTARALLSGLEAALFKLQKYQTLAHENQLCIIATVLNPRFRLKYLERWPELHSRASILFSHVFENYRVKEAEVINTPVDPVPRRNIPRPSKSANAWEDELYSDVPSFVEQFDQELQAYFSGNFPCGSGTSTLGWWKVHCLHFPTVGHMARDFLCIPASSVSVERLFSQCKLTMSDVRSSMLFETARRRICCQHWMKAGIGADAVRMGLQIDEDID
ncbi:Zinc finger BED domain-containing protein DAYSLEEPER [Rhizoctonia solani]|uniref:Zinc finger BED domain-containing protein DAYSLEEPER n=1 Tax=Rhizoctonia solani TaxID=456999 RepID=A0A0K6FP87_9AGAM|nr:Zinc finger BED domain-containing protein DAYSLEEPER [Rhizoctonia solani]